MQDRELFRRILGLESPWQVDSVSLEEVEGEVVIHVSRRGGSALPCPECGQAMTGYDTLSRRWRHLDTCQFQTVLEAAVPRGQCAEHGVHQISVPWAEERSRFTALFERLAIDWMQEAGRSAVARRMRLTWDEAD